MGGCVGGGVTVWICVGGAVGLCVGSAVRECVGVTMTECVGVTEAAGFGGLDDELELHPEIAAPATAATTTIPESTFLLCIFFPPARKHIPARKSAARSRAALPLNFDVFTTIAGLQAFSTIILACRLQAGVAASSAEPW